MLKLVFVQKRVLLSEKKNGVKYVFKKLEEKRGNETSRKNFVCNFLENALTDLF